MAIPNVASVPGLIGPYTDQSMASAPQPAQGKPSGSGVPADLSLSIDPTLGMVVTQFLVTGVDNVVSVPSSQIIEAYHMHEPPPHPDTA
jgi:hypothetical protein